MLKSKALRYGATIGLVAGPAVSVFAQADADDIIGTLDFTGLAANVNSVIGQAFPVAALAAGIALALGFLVWLVAMVRSAVRSRTPRT